MRLATFLIPPSLGAKQGLRLRRFGLAALQQPLRVLRGGKRLHQNNGSFEFFQTRRETEVDVSI